MSYFAERITELWFQNHFAARSPQLKEFVDQIIPLACECKWIEGQVIDDTLILFSAGDGSQSEARGARAKGLFRMVCARLGTLILEHFNTYQFSPHHGECIIQIDAPKETKSTLRIWYINTPSEQRFKIESLAKKENLLQSDSCGRQLEG